MEQKGKPKKFSFIDLTGKDRKIKCSYHGRHKVHLDGRIVREEGSNLIIGVSLYEEDVTYKDYNSLEKSLILWYHHPECGNTIRPSILPMSEYVVPKEIKYIKIFDDEVTFH